MQAPCYSLAVSCLWCACLMLNAGRWSEVWVESGSGAICSGVDDLGTVRPPTCQHAAALADGQGIDLWAPTPMWAARVGPSHPGPSACRHGILLPLPLAARRNTEAASSTPARLSVKIRKTDRGERAAVDGDGWGRDTLPWSQPYDAVWQMPFWQASVSRLDRGTTVPPPPAHPGRLASAQA